MTIRKPAAPPAVPLGESQASQLNGPSPPGSPRLAQAGAVEQTAGTAPNPSARLLRRAPTFDPIGRKIAGRYEVLMPIGSGGMGTVYGAVDTQTGLQVAIKLLNAECFTTANVRRFRREAQTAVAVKNRYVCDVHYLGVEQGVPYIVMERLAGTTLRQRMREQSALSLADAVTVMVQVLEGLSAAHSVGVLHRDIKPANIFLTSPPGVAPAVKVIDFGLAKLIAPVIFRRIDGEAEELTGLTSITATDVIPGTPVYLSPEQLSGARDLDHRVDVWAAGLTLYETLAGRRPFSVTTSQHELARRIAYDPIEPISLFRGDVPAGLDEVLAKALAKNRERFETAAAFRSALIAVWAKHRAAGVAAGELLRKYGPLPTLRTKDSGGDEPLDEPTEINVSVDYDDDPSAS
jgi:serine/threonine protein kinase